ncbi:MAG TPA: transposase [Candidatus Syntrophosphaera sp.]|nr:transposase [Candidatus Syntrophosphaera sp.]
MFRGQQIKIKENLQVKFHQFMRKFRQTFTIPEYKFIQDISLGILKSQSVIINQIAQTLGENISLKKTCERLYRNLRRKDFSERLHREIIAVQSHGLDSETVIIVDDSDIIKSKARKMEGLKKVRDGSTGLTSQNGYDLVNLIACKPDDQGYQIKPLSSELVSCQIETDSLIQITQDSIVEVIVASGNRGVYVFDRGYDKRHMFAFFKEHECDYIVRSKGDRCLIVDGLEKSFLTVAKTVRRKIVVHSSATNTSFNCGIQRVAIRLDGHPKKHPQTAEAWLVVARYVPKKNAKAGFFYFLCDFPNQELNEVQIVQKAIAMYHLRWKIEEVHKQIKQDYGWEKMQLMSYTGLKNMNQLLLLAVCYVYSLKSFALTLMVAFPQLMIYSNRLWKQIFDFVYYRITRVVAYCFSHVTRLNILKYGGKWAESKQLILPCLKNGGM